MGAAWQVADDVIAGLRAGDFEAVAQRFDGLMAERLPASAVGHVWSALERDLGELREVRHASWDRADPAGMALVMTVRCAFERQAVDVRITVAGDGRVAGLYLRPAAPGPRDGRRPMTGPLVLAAVPLAAAVLAAVAGDRPRPVASAVGAGGWLVALALRRPATSAAVRLGLRPHRPVAALLSGPVEEVVRLAAVLLAGRDGPRALWLGLGWGAAEVAFTIGVAMRRGASGAGGDDRPRLVLGLLERASAMAFHIGASLLLFWSAGAVALTAPLHTAVNVAGLRLARRRPARAQLLVAAVGAAVLAGGLALPP